MSALSIARAWPSFQLPWPLFAWAEKWNLSISSSVATQGAVPSPSGTFSDVPWRCLTNRA
ncbi:hypothetical protein EMIT0P228_210020 [Pseudomonas brassicacearum]